MASIKQYILTVNGGSSSIKFALFKQSDVPDLIFSGKIEKIGLPQAIMQVKGVDEADNETRAIAAPDIASSVKILIDWLKNHLKGDLFTAIGYRIVHGGPKYFHPEVITDEMIEELDKLSSFDPNHMPENILLVKVFRKQFPDALHVACFDTAFHHDLPQVARLLPIPRRFEKLGVRRYGFHGLSYQSVMEQLHQSVIANGRLILAHLGSGVSLTAVNNGKSIDTSMSFTPASGVPMGTRSGDIDPGLVWYLSQTAGLDAKKINEMVNFQSGLLGMSETSSDMYELLQRQDKDPRAKEAISVFCYQVKKWIGGFAASLGGIDALVFTGGMGENAPQIRRQICENLGFLGIELDEEQNKRNADIISKAASQVPVYIIHTNEELTIAKLVQGVLEHKSA